MPPGLTLPLTAGGSKSGASRPQSDSSEGGPAANDGPWDSISEDGSPGAAGAGQQQPSEPTPGPQHDSSQGGPAADGGPWDHISEDGSPGATQQRRAPQTPPRPRHDSSQGGPGASGGPWDSISEDGSPGAGQQQPTGGTSGGGAFNNSGTDPWASISVDGSPGAETPADPTSTAEQVNGLHAGLTLAHQIHQQRI